MRHLSVGILAAALAGAPALAQNDEFEKLCRAAVAGQGRVLRHDWARRPSLLEFPVSHDATNVRGGLRDEAAIGGPSIGEARPFASAYLALLLDEAGHLRTNKRSRASNSPFVFDYLLEWPAVSPNPPGDLAAYGARSSGAWSVFGLGGRSSKANRFPAILIDRSGHLSKGISEFHYRYPILRVGTELKPLDADRLCLDLGMSHRPGIALLRPMNADERTQIDHIVRTAHLEIATLREYPEGNAAFEADRARRIRELRAFRFVEIPPFASEGLWLATGNGPVMPESAELHYRFSLDGIGEPKARYAYYASWKRLVEITHASGSSGEAYVMRALVTLEAEPGPEPRVLRPAQMQALLPELKFADDFSGHYLGER